jgi:regulator of sigma E protease
MDSFLFTVAAFLLAIGVLITVHEFGHFWVARKLGVKVLRFSIGFGQPLWKRTGKVDGTEYVVAALPLGGYVKMLDEREGPVAQAELGRAFNRQSVQARSAIVAAGPVANFLFALFAYWLVFMAGESGLKPIVGEVAPDSLAASAGFESGDQLLAVGSRLTPTWEAAVYALLAESLGERDLAVRIRRDDHLERVLRLPGEGLLGLAEDGQILESMGLSVARPELPPGMAPVIGEVLAGEAAERAGLLPGDDLLSADGEPITDWQSWVAYVRERPETPIALRLRRGGETLSITLTPAAVEQEDGTRIGRIGASADLPQGWMDAYRAEVRYGPLDAMGAAVFRTWDMSVLMLKMMGRMVIGQVSVKNLSGPISIAESAGKSASYGLSYFLKFLAVVSISLGVLNLLPVPVLDGGHLLYFLIEAVKGSPVSEQAMEWGQRIGLALLLALMSLAFYLDLSRLLG